MKRYKIKIYITKLRSLWPQWALALMLVLACMASALGSGLSYQRTIPKEDVCKNRKYNDIYKRHIYPTNRVHNEKCYASYALCD